MLLIALGAILSAAKTIFVLDKKGLITTENLIESYVAHLSKVSSLLVIVVLIALGVALIGFKKTAQSVLSNK